MRSKCLTYGLIQLFSTLVLAASSLSVSGETLMMGAASVVITPPLGIPMAGQYYERGATAVHDDLFAKSIVFELKGEKIAIVTCDLVKVTEDLVYRVRKIVEGRMGIPSDHVMVSATHSHTGPVVQVKGRYKPDSKQLQLLTVYLEKLPGLIASSVQRAAQNLKPARLQYGKGFEDQVSFNRRFYMRDGTVGWNPGYLNPDIIRPAGPIDPDVLVLYGESLGGDPLSTFVNFPLHLDIVGGLEISADFPYTMSKILGNVKGKEMVTLFGQGCCANLNHINVKKPGPQKGHKLASEIGTTIAANVLKTYARMESLEVRDVKAVSEVLNLPLASVVPENIPEARKVASTFGKDNAASFMELVEAFKILDVVERKGMPIGFEIQIFALGNDCAIIGLPGEIFTELGIYIRERSPYQHTMVLQLTNGSIGYVPDMKAYIEGNYEPVSARCAPGSGELMVGKVLEMLNEMHEGDL